MGVQIADRVSSAVNALRRDANLEAVLAAMLKEYSLLTCLG